MIIHAHSRKNGITFYSTKLPIVGTETYYDENGHIQTQQIFSKPSDFVHSLELLRDYKQFYVSKFSTFIFMLTILLFSFFVFKISQNFGFIISGLYFCCLGAQEFLKLFKTVIYNKKESFGTFSTAKFHGAEHMVIQAFNTLNRVPTLEEVKKFSRFDRYCGSQNALSNIFLAFIGSLFIIFITHIGLHYSDLMLYICSVVFTLISILLAIFNKRLIFLQIFTTSKPTEKELYLAIEGVRQFVLLEEKLEDEDFSEALKKLSVPLNEIVDKESKEIFGK